MLQVAAKEQGRGFSTKFRALPDDARDALGDGHVRPRPNPRLPRHARAGLVCAS